MKLYNELADWWPLLSAPEDYEEEVNIYISLIRKYHSNVRTSLELGCGGGNNAYYLKKHFKIILTDVSQAMLDVSKRINPDCEHLLGDMRTLRLAQKFDLVFIHDAICYITEEKGLMEVFKTARHHLAPGGVVFIMPDEFKESYVPATTCGGHDRGDRGLRYLEWTYDPDPADSRVTVEYAYIMRDEKGKVYHEHDQSEYGLFPQRTWQELLNRSGFNVHFEKVKFPDQPNQIYYAIIGIRTDK